MVKYVEHKQDGMVLLVVLITMVVMLLGGIALVRSTTSSSMIAENFALKSSTVHSANYGIDAAFNQVANLANAKTTNVPIPNLYFTTMQATNVDGVPSGINWSVVPTIVVPGTGDVASFVIERMCNGSPTDPVNGPAPSNYYELSKYCITDPTVNSQVGSQAAGHVNFLSFGAGALYYRVTVRVSGARGSSSIIQGMISL